MIVIYMINNCVNGKVYIGSTGNINDRFGNHKRTLNRGVHPNEHLQNAWNKYGSDSFEFKTLMVCPDSERNHCEQMFIDLYDSQNRDYGYNIRDADAHSVSEETRLKISKANTGNIPTEEHRRKLSENNARYWKGKTRPDMVGENNPNYGKTGKKNHKWKNFPRIIKDGFKNGKQSYAIQYNGKAQKTSINIFKLIDWCLKEYPDEDLEISMEVVDNALFS